LADRVVFIDESFYEWFGLPKEDSNFCYAAVSLPEKSLPQLALFMNSFGKQVTDFHQEDTGKAFTGGEVKSKYLYELSGEHRRRLAEKLAYFLRKHNGHIFTFFTTSQGFVHNCLRDKYYHEYGKYYSDFLADADKEMEGVKDELVSRWKREPFNLALLEPLYGNLISFLYCFHREQKQTFRVQYDPREKGEDAALSNAAMDIAAIHEQMIQCLGKPERAEVLIGIDTSLSSEDCPGLQLVDLIVADTRRLFRDVAGLRSDCSEPRILSAKYNPAMVLVDGKAPYYPHSLRASTVRELEEVDLLFPQIRPFFARSFASCHATFGEARHIELSSGTILDMAD
jgi:hypothetical protein